MNQSEQFPSVKNDVLHIESHNQLSAEDIAKAVARHRREHPTPGSQKSVPSPKPRTKR
jgi:hypothetical protein